MTKRLALLLLLLAAAGATLWGVWRWSYGEALDKLEAQGQGSLSLAADRLVSQLERYRQLPVVLTDSPVLQAAVRQAGDMQDIDLYLEQVADVTGARDILLLDTSGTTIAAANWREGDSYIGRNFADRPDFIRAMNGALGVYHSQENEGDPRGFYFASAIRVDGKIAGVLSVKVDLEVLEADWRGDPEVIFFTDKNNVVFIANRSTLLLRVLGDRFAILQDPKARRSYAASALQPFPAFSERDMGGRKLRFFDQADDIPARALYLQTPLPVIGMTGNILLDLAPVEQEARLRTALAAAFLALFGLLVLVLLQRRRALAVRLQLEEQANERLEATVAARTAELLAANETLRRTQDELVQAGKLTALGQMSAGISHELNQPLAAIQSYAENAVILLERDRTEDAGKNLDQISNLAARMGRIIRNLRAFARKEGEEMGEVDLVRVVEDTLELANIRMREAGVTLHWQAPNAPVMVRGGGVRLQQVLLNLITNAIDAMEGQAEKHIRLDISRDNDKVFLEVRDNGPGLKNKDQIFEPFYTTKSVGQGDGMGLGLSISYGIVQSFGGRISGGNHAEGGAVFRVELTPAQAGRE